MSLFTGIANFQGSQAIVELLVNKNRSRAKYLATPQSFSDGSTSLFQECFVQRLKRFVVGTLIRERIPFFSFIYPK